MILGVFIGLMCYNDDQTALVEVIDWWSQASVDIIGVKWCIFWHQVIIWVITGSLSIENLGRKSSEKSLEI